MNVASGCPKFFRLVDLDQRGLLVDDTLVFRVHVDTGSTQGVDSYVFR